MPLARVPTRYGVFELTWNDVGLTSVSLPETFTRCAGETLANADVSDGEPEAIRVISERIRKHVSGVPQDFIDVELDWTRVTGFQLAVYRETRRIKPGFTRHYGDIAEALELGPEGARAVGVALGRNPWPLIVPCHRVVAANGAMTGFSAPGGIRTKTRLLALEGAELMLE